MGWFSCKAGAIALAVHSTLVVGTALVVRSGLKQSSEAAGLWLLWYALDFPASLGAGPAESSLRDVLDFDTLYIFGFACYFLVFGGLQYFIAVGTIGGLYSRFVRPRENHDDRDNQTTI
ncbi:hypothetical protein RISK_000291 [Rhodopirellula islandica]|uniref:Transmembrane protein n=1 Tax=Rhodopirellula islandica TaxID=595434 RepID=A0A0J1BMF9_RHOIS|nr:hypothetical protein RISK_000291 [Rhodopirellula islandica]